MTRDDILKLIHPHRSHLKQTFGFNHIFLFGSFATQKNTDKSDIDLLIDTDKISKTYRNHLAAKAYLEALFHRKIDLVYKDAINPVIQQDIQESLIELE